MTDTACVDVMPTGLSRMIQPCTSRFLRFFAGCAASGTAAVPASGAFAIGADSFIVSLVGEVALHCRSSQKLLDALGFAEALVEAKTNLRCKFQVNAPRDFAAHVLFVAVERLKHVRLVAAAKWHDVDGGEPQIGAHAYFGHGDHVRFHHRIVDIAARQHAGELVADQFTDAKLTLRASCGLIAMLLMTCHLLLLSRAGLPCASRLNLLCSYERDCRVKSGNDAERMRT